ncbi:MAG: lysophospholipid acyltransferase family protein [Desulfobacterales bacterium]|nr:lysophospholipid acyltransferase family protein [Desulfobacterales bacterium]
MNQKVRPEIPREKIIKVNNKHKIDFDKPYKFIYMDWWYDLLVAIPFLISYLLVIFCARFWGFRAKGKKNLEILKKQGCITISNHCHYFDTVFANYIVLPKPLHTAVAQRNCEVPFVRQLLRMHRAFPIPANGRGLEMITGPVGEALKRKHHVHFLPEGELVLLSQTIHRFRRGAFILSYKHQAPIVPIVYVIKRRKFRGKEMGPAWLKFIQVIGEPMFPPSLRDGGSTPMGEIENYADRAATWMETTLEEYHKEDTL